MKVCDDSASNGYRLYISKLYSFIRKNYFVHNRFILYTMIASLTHGFGQKFQGLLAPEVGAGLPLFSNPKKLFLIIDMAPISAPLCIMF